jgi:fatty-acyl-CoA synthase/long-chain acyl-CoA synthetase
MEMTIRELLETTYINYPHREAFVFKDGRATYGEYYLKVNQKANALLEIGIKKGDHVGLMFPNCMEVLESILALWSIGVVIVPLSFRLSPPELTYILDHSDTSSIVFHEMLAKLINTVVPNVPNIKKLICSGKNPPEDYIDFEKIAKDQSTDPPNIELKEDDMLTIMYTSGTTGTPKGVVMTHGRMVWAAINLGTSNINGYSRGLTMWPFFHISAFLNLCTTLSVGNTMVYMSKFDPVEMLETMEREKINGMGAPPTVYKMVLRTPNIEKYDLSSVTGLASGSEVMPDETRKQLQKVFTNAGIANNYGMSETSGAISTRRAEYTESKPFSIGLPQTHMRVRVVDDDGNDVPFGEIGEIIVSGPSVMKEYYKMPEKTAKTIVDGWLHTDDMGRFDEDRFLYIIERKHNMIKSGGENIYPKEIEEVLYKHPKVLEAAVFGLPDETYGQKVCAAIVPKPGEEPTAGEIIGFVTENLASFKKPKEVFFRTELPKNPIGKILRKELKEMYAK